MRGTNMTLRPITEFPEHWQTWYQEWDANVLESKHKSHLRSELLGKPGSQQSYSAAFELFLFSAFNNMGLRVAFQPESNNANPDFCVSDNRGHTAYVEAGVMFNNPLETELHYLSIGMPIWEEFKKLQSQEFKVQHASSSGNPGNVGPRSVRNEVQQWINQLDTPEVCTLHAYGILPYKTFHFGDWTLDVKLDLKSPEDKTRLGARAVETTTAGFSGGYSDGPAQRLESKLMQKSSQVRKTGGHCIIAITERQQGFSVEDAQTALLGGNSECFFGNQSDESHPYLKGLSIPQLKTDGLWSPHRVKEPIAVLIHRGSLLYPDHGEMELWLNPNSSYFLVPRPLFALKTYSAVQKIWTRPAVGL